MQTYFAPAERATDEQLQRDIEFVSHEPVITALMDVLHGLLAVLNEQRQILAVNDNLLEYLGIEDAQTALGLRPGEALECVHAKEPPSGCGTTEICASCGAVIAIMASLDSNETVERYCTLNCTAKGQPADLYLLVRACPIAFDERRLLLLFVQDMTKQQQWAMMERVFFHDISNVINGILQTAQIFHLNPSACTKQRTQRLYDLSLRLSQEVEIQRCLSIQEASSYSVVLQNVTVGEILKELDSTFSDQPLTHNRTLALSTSRPELVLRTDSTLVLRVLTNMVTNALEATMEQGEVKVWTEHEQGGITFCVWNAHEIPPNVAKRIFQRNFSTKQMMGRGLGTYSMKVFGETFLRGKVDFTTSQSEGTTFRFTLPGQS